MLFHSFILIIYSVPHFFSSCPFELVSGLFHSSVGKEYASTVFSWCFCSVWREIHTYDENNSFYPYLLVWRSYFTSFNRDTRLQCKIKERSHWVIHLMYYLKNEKECIIRFKNSRRSRKFLHQITHDCEGFERLQNLWYKSTHSYTNI